MSDCSWRRSITSGRAASGFVAPSRAAFVLASCRNPTHPLPRWSYTDPNSTGSHARPASKALQQRRDANRPNVGDPIDYQISSDHLIRCVPSDGLARNGRIAVDDSLREDATTRWRVLIRVAIREAEGSVAVCIPIGCWGPFWCGLCKSSPTEVGRQRLAMCDSNGNDTWASWRSDEGCELVRNTRLLCRYLILGWATHDWCTEIK